MVADAAEIEYLFIYHSKPPMNDHQSLDLDDQPDLHQKGWRVQRIIWVLLGLFIAAGALGVFGGGPLSKQTEGEKGPGWWLEYDRFARKDAPMQLELHLPAGDGDTAVLHLQSSYLRRFRIESITPAPHAVRTQQERVTYYFPARGPLTVLFHFKPDKIGNARGTLRVNGHSFALHHFIYP
jgi:hypothetical protein